MCTDSNSTPNTPAAQAGIPDAHQPIVIHSGSIYLDQDIDPWDVVQFVADQLGRLNDQPDLLHYGLWCETVNFVEAAAQLALEIKAGRSGEAGE